MGQHHQLLYGGGADLIETPQAGERHGVLVQADHHRSTGLDSGFQSQAAEEISARVVLVLVDDEDVDPDVDLCKDGVLEVPLQGLHHDYDSVTKCVADECMWGHIYIGPQLVDKAAALYRVVRGRYDDLLLYFFRRHIWFVGLHDLLIEFHEKLQTHTFVRQPIRWGGVGWSC